MIDKTFYIYAGVNGAGKTSLYKFYHCDGVRINSDEEIIKLNGNWQNPYDQLKASKECLKLQQQCLQNGLSINRESTLCSKEIMKSIYLALSLDYQIIIYLLV